MPASAGLDRSCGRRNTSARFTIVSFTTLALLLSPPLLSADRWCEGIDDDLDGFIDNGCDRTCPAPVAEHGPVGISPSASATRGVQVVRSGTGLAWAWSDTRTGVEQVRVRVTALSGTGDDPETGLGDGSAPAHSPAIVWNGSGFGVAWVDERDGDPDIHFAILDSTGVPVAAPPGSVSSNNTDSLNPSVAWNGSEYLVAWDDSKGPNRDVYVRRLDSTGAPLASSQRLTSDSAVQEHPTVAWDGVQWAVAWTDHRHGDTEIYALRLDATAQPVGSDTRMTSASGTSGSSRIAGLQPSEFGLVWQDARSGTASVWYAGWQGPGWTAPAGVEVDASTSPAVSPSITTTGADVLVAWEDRSGAIDEVALRRLAPDGTLLDAATVLTSGAGADGMALAWHGSGLAVGYAGDDGGTWRPFLVLAGCCTEDLDLDGYGTCDGDCNESSAGQNPGMAETCDGLDTNCDGTRDETCRGTCRAEMPTEPLELAPNDEGSDDTHIVWDGTGYGVVWEQNELVPNVGLLPAPYFLRLDSEGVPIGSPVRVTDPDLWGREPTIAWTGEEYLVVYGQFDGTTAISSIASARFDASGTRIGTPRVVTDNDDESDDQIEPEVAWNEGRLAVVYNNFIVGVGTPRTVQFLRLDRQGRPLGRPRDLTPIEGTDYGHVSADVDGGFAAAYGRLGELYLRRLDRWGGIAGPEHNITADPTGDWPRVEATPWGYGYFWRDSRDYDNLYYRGYGKDGTPLTDEVDLFEGRSASIDRDPSVRWIGAEFQVAHYERGSRDVLISRILQDGSRSSPDVSVDSDPDGHLKGSVHLSWNGIRPAVVWVDFRSAPDARPFISVQTCCEDVPAPAVVTGASWLDASTLEWDDTGTGRYDRVKGDLNVLRDGAGDWTSSVAECADDLGATSSNETAVPALGRGDYYLVRGDSVCWTGTWDTGGSGQSSGRDDGIAASPNACP